MCTVNYPVAAALQIQRSAVLLADWVADLVADLVADWLVSWKPVKYDLH